MLFRSHPSHLCRFCRLCVCSSVPQERVLIDAYKMCLAALTHCHSGFTDGEQPITLSMSGHSVDTIRYCVSQEKVSIHLPVSRILAGTTPPTPYWTVPSATTWTTPALNARCI